MANELIKIEIDPKAILIAKDAAGKFLIDKNAETGLLKLLELQRKVEETIEAVKDLYSIEMEKAGNVLKIEGEAVNVTKQFFGDRYEIFDKEMALSQGVAKQVTSTKVDPDAVDTYLKANGQLPEGIKLRERSAKVQIREKKKKV